MSDDTNLDNRLAQGRWESVHANDFALLDTPEQRIGVLKELLDNLKKGIGEAKGRPPAVTAEDAGTLAEGGRYSELKHCVDREGLLARLEQEIVAAGGEWLSQLDRSLRAFALAL